MEFTLKLDKEDWFQFQKIVGKSAARKSRNNKLDFGKNIVIWLLIAFLFMTVIDPDSAFDKPTAIFTSLIFGTLIAIYFYNLKRIQKAFFPDEEGSFLKEKSYKLDDSGLEVVTENYSCKMEWDYFLSLDRKNGIIMLYIDNVAAYIFPESKIENPDDFYSKVCGYIDL